MEVDIEHNSSRIKANVIEWVYDSTCVLFLSGGNLTVGGGRYRAWQHALQELGVSSVSFDHSGVNGSGTSLETSSLSARIDEAACVAEWIQDNLKIKNIIVYGASMGGYVGLGLTQRIPKSVDALMLYAPAAYDPDAHGLRFDGSFTQAIRKERSWSNSLSYEWIRSYTKPVTLIAVENDEVIPLGVIERYRESAQEHPHFTYELLQHGTHNCWGDTEADVHSREIIFKRLLDIIGK